MVSHYTTLVPSWGCALGQPVGQASALVREGGMCHLAKERKNTMYRETSDAT